MQRGQTSNTTTTKPPIITLEEQRNIQKRGPSEKHLTSPPLIPSPLSRHITPQEHSTQILLLRLLLRSQQLDMYLNPHPYNPPPPSDSLRLATPLLPSPPHTVQKKPKKSIGTNQLTIFGVHRRPHWPPHHTNQSSLLFIYFPSFHGFNSFNHSFIISSIYPCAPACRHSLTHLLT